MRDQTKLTFSIGYPAAVAAFEYEICVEASRLCGGCTMNPSKVGFWAQDGAEPDKINFGGPFEMEHTFELELTCEDVKLSYVYNRMQIFIKAMVEKHSIETNWVHVVREPVVGMHFDAKDVEDKERSLIRDILSPGTRGAH